MSYFELPSQAPASFNTNQAPNSINHNPISDSDFPSQLCDDVIFGTSKDQTTSTNTNRYNHYMQHEIECNSQTSQQRAERQRIENLIAKETKNDKSHITTPSKKEQESNEIDQDFDIGIQITQNQVDYTSKENSLLVYDHSQRPSIDKNQIQLQKEQTFEESQIFNNLQQNRNVNNNLTISLQKQYNDFPLSENFFDQNILCEKTKPINDQSLITTGPASNFYYNTAQNLSQNTKLPQINDKNQSEICKELISTNGAVTMNVLKQSGGAISSITGNIGVLNYQNDINQAYNFQLQNQQQRKQAVVGDLQNFMFSGTMSPPKSIGRGSSQNGQPPQSQAISSSSQLQYETSRQKQISSGSEKRLKMQQQRQYFSDQYRVAQQRQHQQTANAVLSQSGPSNSLHHPLNWQNQINNNVAQIDKNFIKSQQKMGDKPQSFLAEFQGANAQLGATSKITEQFNITINRNSNLINGQYHSNQLTTVGAVQLPNYNVMTGRIQQTQQQLASNQNVANNFLLENQLRDQKDSKNIQQLNYPQPVLQQQFYSQQRPKNAIGLNNQQNTLMNSLGNPNSNNTNNFNALASAQQQPQGLRQQTLGIITQIPITSPGQIVNNNLTFQNLNNGQNALNIQQQFLKKRASSNNTANISNSLPLNQIQVNQNNSVINTDQQNYQSQTTNNLILPQKNQQNTKQPSPSTDKRGQELENGVQDNKDGQSKQQENQVVQQTQQQQPQQPPKIPVICGFHKRILLITCQNNNQNNQGQPNGMPGSGNLSTGLYPNSSLSQTRRIRNKNPNCNHNSNSAFYQPHYNNVKYDDSHKKKEDVLRKVFFKECAKEEEKRMFSSAGNSSINGTALPGQGYQTNQSQFSGNNLPGSFMTGQSISGTNYYGQANELARQQALTQANDPNKHLQIIERILCEYLFVPLPFDRNQKTQLSNTQSLMMELGLDRALTPHRGFLLALIRAGKFNAENMLKVLSEVKTSATEFDNECIYCKYSQYALKESQKLMQKTLAAIQEQMQTNPQQALVQQQQIQANGGIIKGQSGEDIRIENLVRMFQSQLFKKSFINTSLMIIQRKMTEKYFQKYQLAKQAQQAATNGQLQQGVVYGPDGKPIDQNKRIVKKPKTKAQNMSNLEYLGKEIQKLAKNLANPKDKEKYLELKEKYYREFLIKILRSNGVENIKFPTATFAPYKYYIGRGNNSGLVRTALKSRFWWSMGDYDDWQEYNFIWTQWKSNKILTYCKPWKEIQEREGIEADKKRSGLSTRGAHESQLSTQATDKESCSSKENLITTPKKNKLASASLGHAVQNTAADAPLKKQLSSGLNNSGQKQFRNIRGKKEEEEPVKEENVTSHNILCYGKMENNFHLSNKKAIFYNMKVYYEAIGVEYFQRLPLTFHIKEGLNDVQFQKFEQLYNDANDNSKETILDQIRTFGKNLWIIKPGENTNRGCGIQVSKDLEHIKSLVQNTNINGMKRSYIIQKYIEKPLLYKSRKFDIRCYSLMVTINGNLQGYWYTDGYLRTSSREFTLKNVNNRFVHLTNDAVQKRLEDYGKFEQGNKLSYPEFQKYLDSIERKCDFVKEVVPRMKQMVQDSMRAVSRKIDPNRKYMSFEIFGYDFMIDEDLNPFMIEANTNPCFELSSPYLARLIPAMVENALKIAVDPVYPPPPIPMSKKHQCPDAQENKFEIIFNEREDASDLKNLPIDDNMNGIIEEEEMEEEGSDNDEEDFAQD